MSVWTGKQICICGCLTCKHGTFEATGTILQLPEANAVSHGERMQDAVNNLVWRVLIGITHTTDACRLSPQLVVIVTTIMFY